MRHLLLAAAGGALGSAARYLVNVGAARTVGTAFPWSTLTVNVLGCFAMGIVTEWLLHRLGGGAEWRIFLTTGILGGFTTFSAFALDFAALWRGEATFTAGLYVLASVALSLLAVFAGIAAGRMLMVS